VLELEPGMKGKTAMLKYGDIASGGAEVVLACRLGRWKSDGELQWDPWSQWQQSPVKVPKTGVLLQWKAMLRPGSGAMPVLSDVELVIP
jgi:hypothetical protein